jgi:hypothetical protein
MAVVETASGITARENRNGKWDSKHDIGTTIPWYPLVPCMPQPEDLATMAAETALPACAPPAPPAGTLPGKTTESTMYPRPSRTSETQAIRATGVGYGTASAGWQQAAPQPRHATRQLRRDAGRFDRLRVHVPIHAK